MRELISRKKVLILIGIISLILSPVFLFPIYQPFTKINKENNSSRITGYELVAEDNIAYIGTHDSGLRIIDFSQPMSPKTINSVLYDRDGSGNDIRYRNIAYEDSICYIIGTEDDGYSNLIIINVSSPINPGLLGFHNFSFSPSLYSIQVWNKTIFLGTSDGVQVFDASDPTNLIFTDQQGNSSCKAIFKSGDLLLSGEDDLLCIYRITQLKTLVKMSEFVTTDTSIEDISAYGDLACFTSFSSIKKATISLIDISDHRIPEFIFSLSVKKTFAGYMTCYLSDTLYVGMSGQLLQYDISNQRNIELIGTYPHYTKSISAEDNYIFLFNPDMIILSNTLYIGLNIQSLFDFWIIMIIGTAVSYILYRLLQAILVLLKTYPLDNSTNLR